MIDFSHIEAYKENNRIEAKKALGGLPHSIWETYSAFANTLGGILLLGVEETADKSFRPVNLPAPEWLIEDFWEQLNDPKKVSVNLLSRKDITIEEVDGKRLVAIRIPRANRTDKPVYIDGNPFTGSYRRGGEGDYSCTADQVRAMMRDAADRTPDMTVMETVPVDAIDRDTLGRYRRHMKRQRAGHMWEHLNDDEFLLAIGALAKGNDARCHPTVAGLLMFGTKEALGREFPHLRPTYQGMHPLPSPEPTNLYDFYITVCRKLARDLSDIPPTAQEAMREAVANCLIHADYYEKGSIAICREATRITLKNPGGFRTDAHRIRTGGHPDPRNEALSKLFQLVNIGEGTGGGIPKMIRAWQAYGWNAPVLEEGFEPPHVVLTLPLTYGDNQSQKAPSPSDPIRLQNEIINYLTKQISATAADLAALSGLSQEQAKALVGQLIADKIVVMTDDLPPRYRLQA